MTTTLYQFDGAPPSWRVRLGFAFKGIDVDTHSLSYEDEEHKGEEMLRLNPRARLPFLSEKKTRLQNSLAILAWLDWAYPQPRLLGSHADEAAEIWQLVMDGYDFFRDANRKMLSVAFADHLGRQEEEQLRDGSHLAHVECRRIEKKLTDGRRYLCGNHPTAADAFIYPETRLILRAVKTKPVVMSRAGFDGFSERYPMLSNWLDGLSALPHVAATIPAHWKS